MGRSGAHRGNPPAHLVGKAEGATIDDHLSGDLGGFTRDSDRADLFAAPGAAAAVVMKAIR